MRDWEFKTWQFVYSTDKILRFFLDQYFENLRFSEVKNWEIENSRLENLKDWDFENIKVKNLIIWELRIWNLENLRVKNFRYWEFKILQNSINLNPTILKFTKSQILNS